MKTTIVPKVMVVEFCSLFAFIILIMKHCKPFLKKITVNIFQLEPQLKKTIDIRLLFHYSIKIKLIFRLDMFMPCLLGASDMMSRLSFKFHKSYTRFMKI